jgi:hypothetical protein
MCFGPIATSCTTTESTIRVCLPALIVLPCTPASLAWVRARDCHTHTWVRVNGHGFVLWPHDRRRLLTLSIVQLCCVEHFISSVSQSLHSLSNRHCHAHTHTLTAARVTHGNAVHLYTLPMCVCVCARNVAVNWLHRSHLCGCVIAQQQLRFHHTKIC